MSPDLRAAEVLLLAVLLVVGLGGQVWLFLRTDSRTIFPKRLYVPLVSGLLVFVGCAAHIVLTWIDPNKPNLSLNEAAWLLGRALFFWISLMMTSYFGPLSVCGSLMSSVYLGCEYQDWRLWPVIDVVFDLAFGGLPAQVAWLYKGATFLWLAIGSIADGIFGASSASSPG